MPPPYDAKVLAKSRYRWIPIAESFLGICLVALLGLWWLMLLMTALYFHSAYEKALGTVLGLAYWAALAVM